MDDPRASKVEATDLQYIKDILRSMGVTDYEPGVLSLLLNFTHRLVDDLRDTSRTVGALAGLSTDEKLTSEDVSLAMAALSTTRFREPPAADKLAQLARDRNSQLMPELSKKYGLLLPPDEECQVQPNYSVKESGAVGGGDKGR